MAVVREIVSLGRSARMGAKLKVRQPLAKVEVILANQEHRGWLEDHSALIREELNVKQVEFPPKADQYISYTVLPDLKRLGPRLGKRLPAVRQAISQTPAAELLARMERDGQVSFDSPDGPVTLDREDLQIRLEAKAGWAAAEGTAAVVVVSTELTPELQSEGLAREFVHAVQTLRKDENCEYTDRIELGLATDSEELREATARFADYIRSETLATVLHFEPLAGAAPTRHEIGEHVVEVYLRVVPSRPHGARTT
jgi:isoleucyl-tRNA synthetase